MLVDGFKSMDHGGYYFFRHMAQHFPLIVPPMTLGDWLGSYFVVGPIGFLAVVLLLAQGRTRAGQITLGTFVLGVILVEIVRYVLGAHRPADAETQLDPSEMLRSFPAREVFTFTLAATLLLFAAWDRLPKTVPRMLLATNLVILILWVAVSQLVLGLHFVTDVMAGMAGGLALALLASRFFPPPSRAEFVRERLPQDA